MEHFVRQEPIPYESAATPVRSANALWRILLRVGNILRGLMDDRKPSPYSSISPRRMDGTHTDIFPFNNSSNGGGMGGGL